jgi:hypothetical protein
VSEPTIYNNGWQVASAKDNASNVEYDPSLTIYAICAYVG